MLAKRPMQKEVKAEMAAVAVTRSRLTTALQRRYSSLVTHRSVTSAGQTQVPPVSAKMVAEDDEHCFRGISNEDHTIDRDDVGHGEEGSESSAELSEEAGILAFIGLRERSVRMSNLM